MAAAPPASAPTGEDLGFLVVDEFLRTLVDARALKSAFELGLVERLVEHRSGSVEALGRAIGADPRGCASCSTCLRRTAWWRSAAATCA